MCQILCAGEAFGYGTTSAILSIISRVEHDDVEFSFIGNGVSLEMARRFPFSAYLEADTSTFEDTLAARQAFESADYVLAVINPHAMRVAVEVGTPCVGVDTLAFMWNHANVPGGVYKFFAENFPGVPERLERFAADLPPAEIIGPVIDDRFRAAQVRADQILISLGGLSSWLVPDSVLEKYVVSVWRCLESALEDFEDGIIVCGRPRWLRLTEELAATGPLADRPHRFTSLPPSIFLTELARSRALISTPGTRTIFESFTYGTPAAFLPAHTMADELALQVLQKDDVAPGSVSWSELFRIPSISGLDEAEGCAVVNASIERFANGEGNAAELLTERLHQFLRDPAAFQPMQKAWVRRLGSNGATRVAQYIESLR